MYMAIVIISLDNRMVGLLCLIPGIVLEMAAGYMKLMELAALWGWLIIQ